MITDIEKMTLTPCEVFQTYAKDPYILFFDSADEKHPHANYSYILWHPLKTLIWDAYTAKDNNQTGPFKTIQTWQGEISPPPSLRPDLPPFLGGVAGYCGYDTGRILEPDRPSSARKDCSAPDFFAGLYTTLYAYDHRTSQGFLILHGETQNDIDARKAHILQTLKTSHGKNISADNQPSASQTSKNTNAPIWNSNFTQDNYISALERIITYIRDGDIFQTNLAQRFECAKPDGYDPIKHYLYLRRANPAPYAGYINTGTAHILSCSPELFLECKEGYVTTKPIKGTASVHPDTAINEAHKEKLLNNEKDRAENIMIVDLLRNDLSKVCTAESINVPKLCEVETFSSVHHLVSTVTGRLSNDKTALDLFCACFPGGSITGAPKIRAMEIIEELEGLRRGPYTGSMFCWGFNGYMNSNIMIRTLIAEDNRLHCHAGGGITLLSDPKAEYQETLDKAAAILKSLDMPHTIPAPKREGR